MSYQYFDKLSDDAKERYQNKLLLRGKIYLFSILFAALF